MQINFAYQTFRWDSEASLKAHVHCVIVGFTCFKENKPKHIYVGENQCLEVQHVNGYLVNAEDVFIDSRKKPLCNIPEMLKGSIPVDGGALIIEAKDYNNFIKQDPSSVKFIRQIVGAEEFINNKKRYCLWLEHANPADVRNCPLVLERVKKVREMRLASSKEATRKFADYPMRFMEIRQPNNDYILVPSHSSENRRYIPLGFMSPDIISTNANLIIPNANLYHFGILTSSVHMAWMRVVCGRLEMRYRYSNTIVYNNFPWPSVTPEQEAEISRTAQAILDARNLHPNCSLADLYDETTMPVELRRAHQANDKAVMRAYGLPVTTSESDTVAHLFKLYEELTK